MPDVKPNEDRKDYMARCMGDSKTAKKYPNPAQRAAVCNSMFKDAKEASVAQIIKTVKALQYGKPGKKDPRKTPAKPSERRKGSKKNKPGSAEKPNKNIKTGEGTEAKLRNLMTEHNKKNKGSKASMGALKAVFRRGTGAFSKSHAPKMSRSGWGIARVKAFLYLLRNGRPSNPNYKQDNDLLPKGHPRAGGKKKEEAKASESEMIGTGDDNLETVDDSVQASLYSDTPVEAVEYQGRKVTLNKPFRMPKGNSKKFGVYAKNEKGNVVLVRFGDPNMEIRRDDPDARRNYRKRMGCDTARVGPKWKANYWSCWQWRSGAKVKATMHDEWMANETPSYYFDMEIAEAEDSCCDDCHEHETSCAEEAVAAEPSPNSTESHDEYMTRCQKAGYSEEQCMAAHKDHAFKEEASYDKEDKEASYHSEGGSCKEGYKKEGAMCVRVAVTLDLKVEEIDTVLEASTGKTVMRIKGVAFTDGINKNSWGIRPALAKKLADEMVGADVTLNHPKAEMGRFRRNMDGGVDEATVGEVTSASYHERDGGYIVKYVAEVYRSELFSALESGLWLRPEYGVSIGGTGVPSEVVEAEIEGQRPTMWFADDFNFDHLAIVHKPAYSEANIEIVEKVEASEIFKYHTNSSTIQPKVANMSDELNETIETQVNEIEALKADLVLQEARISEFMAAEESRAEEARLDLVSKATELGLAGHDDFSVETLEKVIASWEASRPAPVAEPVVEMEAATPAASAPIASQEASEPVVANFLNGKKVESPVSLYARAYNSWVVAYNQAYSGVHSAKKYEDLQ
tara:strand:- start:400 stop:2790 length:2391 start_codon:yes stop_codon:yes gene_type:complete